MILKVVGTTVFTGLSSVVGAVAIFPESFGIYPAITLYMTSDSSSSSGTTTPISSSNYECKLKTKSDSFECHVSSYKVRGTKQHKNHHQLNSAFPYFYEPVTSENLKKSENIFKVIFSIKDWEEKHETEDIELVVKNDKTSQKYATLKTLGGTYKHKTIGKIKYLVGKAKSDVATVTGYDKCEFGDSIKTSSKVCKVFDFASTNKKDENFENLTFQKTNTSATTIVQDQHYLIELDSEEQIHNFKHKKITCLKESGASEKVIFEELKISVYKADSEFILIV